MINNEYTLNEDEDFKEVCKIFNEILNDDFSKEVYTDMINMGYSQSNINFYIIFEVLKKEMPKTFGYVEFKYDNKQMKWVVKK